MAAVFDPIRGLSDATRATRGLLGDLGDIFAGRLPPRPASFRGVPFLVWPTNDEFGRRLAIHEFPKWDVPYCEDMGRRARVFVLDAAVIGRNWEQTRNALIAACENREPGTLTHPEYGDFTVLCEQCSVDANRVQAYGRTNFQLRFVETGPNEIPPPVTNPLLEIRNALADFYDLVKDVMTSAYLLATLPAYLRDYVSTMLGTAAAPFDQTSNATVASARRQLRQLARTDGGAVGDVTDPVVVSARVTTLVRSLNSDAARAAEGIPTTASVPGAITVDPLAPLVALDILEQVAQRPRPVVPGDAPLQVRYRSTVAAVDTVWKAAAAAEAAHASTFVTFESGAAAHEIRDRVLAIHDAALAALTTWTGTGGKLAAVDQVYQAVALSRARFVRDIEQRAPSLDYIVTLPVTDPTPALVLAYEYYGDAGRADEIVRRNAVRHPGFVVGPVEFLREAA